MGSAHKLDGYENVVAKRCEIEGCSRRPSFGLEWNKPLSCSAHKLDGYENVRTKICEIEGCSRRPSFGLEWKKPLSCSAHKLDGYENVVAKRCEIEGCSRKPSFGLEWRKPLSCSAHKLDGYENVVAERCEIERCSRRPSFGLEWNKPLSCSAHKLDGYENVVTKRCEIEGCSRLPSFGLEWKKTLFCRDHKLDGHVDVRNARCASSACTMFPILERGRGRYKIEWVNKCGSCVRSEHLDLLKRFKVKTEHFVLAELQRRMPELENNFLSWDCPLPCAISTERADMLWQIGSTLLHVEVDEIATHEDDRKRLMRLLAGTDSVDHIVVRIHTHSYDNYRPCVIKSQINGEWVVSCRQKESTVGWTS
ncbi:unnamed protein product [Ectocarpus sp. CCAP 1310/34]|nr:unnamed protein product [Ectocarpus sp. CCAP 1310/34]